MHSLDDTIVAIASPLGGAARGIVRLSGPNLRGSLDDCFRPDPPAPLATIVHSTVVHGVLSLGGFASSVPGELYLWPGKRSYTGQPVAEVHTLGSPPVLEAVVRAACRGGARPAEPGEFTLRAFLAGRIDLTQAEAVLGVIDAAGAAELDAALKQLAGGLAAPLRQLRNNLLELLAHLEAGFDFADEDLPFITAEELLRQLDAASSQVDELTKKLAFRGESAARARVALVGPPNVGKSSLFNALAGRQGAIVSDVPGTTRDYLTAELDLDGVKCELVDTAGIDDTVGPSCREGLMNPSVEDNVEAGSETQTRSPFRQNGPTGDAQSPLPAEGTYLQVDLAAQRMTHEQFRAARVRVICAEREAMPGAAEEIFVLTKCDKHVGLPSLTQLSSEAGKPDVLPTSAVTGEGIPDLKAAIRAAVLRLSGPQGEVVAGTAVRCGESLRLAAASLDRARAATSAGLGEELIAAEVRIALNELGKVAGAVYTDDVLDRIFSRFCIGK